MHLNIHQRDKNHLKWQKLSIYLFEEYFESSHWPKFYIIIEKEKGLIICTGTSHQGLTETLWLQVWGALISSINIIYKVQMASWHQPLSENGSHIVQVWTSEPVNIWFQCLFWAARWQMGRSEFDNSNLALTCMTACPLVSCLGSLKVC